MDGACMDVEYLQTEMCSLGIAYAIYCPEYALQTPTFRIKMLIYFLINSKHIFCSL